MPKDLQNLIQFPQSNNFKAECPNCNGERDLYKFQTESLVELKQVARVKGRSTANRMVKQMDKVFHPQKLNPDDAKVIFPPVDYVVFNGIKENKLEGLDNIVLLDGEKRTTEGRKIQKSIMKAVDKGNYEWITLRVENDGGIKEE